jgi:nucleoside-diphosphate-sugar epimerase
MRGGYESVAGTDTPAEGRATRSDLAADSQRSSKPLKVTVTGATGFVGRHVVAALVGRGHEVTGVARRAPAETLPWSESVKFVACDVHDDAAGPPDLLDVPDVLIHLAWPGLPHYMDLFHFERNLPADYLFIKRMVLAGTRQVLITGTCLEYGMRSGQLAEDASTEPHTPYGLAKDTLRRFLQQLQERQPFVLQWARLFYLYGPGQKAGSILVQLDRAIDAGERRFNMTRGEQLRDYLPVQEAARRLVELSERRDFTGVVNCCSGRPVSIRSLVEARIKERGADIDLNLGYRPYPEYEPFAFWGCRRRLDHLLGPHHEP